MKFQLTLSLLLIFIICSSADAQQRKMRYKINYRHSIEPVVTYYRGFNVEQERETTGFFDSRETYDGSLFDYRQFGINYAYTLTHRLSLVTGIQFSNPALRTSASTTLKIANIRADDAGKLQQSGVVIRRQFYELPTLVRFTITSANVCKSFVEFGVTHQIYRHSRSKDLVNDYRRKQFSFIEDQEKYHATAQLNIGGEFLIAGVLPAFTQLNMNYQLDPMQQVGRVDRNLGIGFTTGVRFRM